MSVRRGRKWLLAFTVVVAVAGFWGFQRALPYQGFPGEVFVDIPRGTGTEGIADLLAHAGVVRSRWDFLAARVISRGRVLQAGEYRFNHPATPFEVYNRVARGDVFYFELVIPEGKNIFDIAAAAEQLGLFPAAQFLAAARDPSLIRDLDPHAPTLEGYLFPNTYKLSRHTTPEHLCRTMTASFRDAWRSLGSSADVHRTVTLASLVEKEGKLADERPRIAAVFENRLRIAMKLDCDPTTIYAALLDDRYRGTIHRSDLDSENPYNTYRHAGLPPGPIANPGVASMRAVLSPAESDALYFVARPDGSGGHQFSNNIAAHEAATDKYRRGQRK
ncbi:MAG TPA: endolytic transglycosylase MltG [Bryobacteraceae bacterium]